jgi:hypothetical protein
MLIHWVCLQPFRLPVPGVGALEDSAPFWNRLHVSEKASHNYWPYQTLLSTTLFLYFLSYYRLRFIGMERQPEGLVLFLILANQKVANRPAIEMPEIT